MKVSFWYSFPLIDSCSYPREFSYRGTSRGYYPRIDLPREDVYISGRMLPLPQPMPSIVSSTSLLEHPRQSICLTPTLSSRRIGAIGDVTPKSILITAGIQVRHFIFVLRLYLDISFTSLGIMSSNFDSRNVSASSLGLYH